MRRSEGPDPPAGYDKNVFINCPFDDRYKPIFEALVFTVFHCGLRARCALEVDDSSETRIKKITRIIHQCRFGIHDLSRTELNQHDLPRFNMPLELGLFLGAKRFGNKHQKKKSCLVLDVENFRFQNFISDIAGQDIKGHGGLEAGAISAVREWIANSGFGAQPIAGDSAILARFERFKDDLPTVCAVSERAPGRLTFSELADVTSAWLKKEREHLATIQAIPSPASAVQPTAAPRPPHGPG